MRRRWQTHVTKRNAASLAAGTQLAIGTISIDQLIEIAQTRMNEALQVQTIAAPQHRSLRTAGSAPGLMGQPGLRSF
jgi:ribosomal protein L11